MLADTFGARPLNWRAGQREVRLKMLDRAANSVTVRNTVAVDHAGRATPVVEYTYWLDTNGPFQAIFPAGQDTPQAVQQAVAEQAAKLRALGILKQPGAM